MRSISRLVLLLIILSVVPARAQSRTGSTRTATSASSEHDVLRDFEQILDLWRDGRYGDLYDRIAPGKESKEAFAGKLASAPRRPACCWEKMQDAQVSLKSERAALLRARLGFEGHMSGTEFVTKGFTLKKQDGLWLISQTDLYALANVSRKKMRYKYLPIQPK